MTIVANAESIIQTYFVKSISSKKVIGSQYVATMRTQGHQEKKVIKLVIEKSTSTRCMGPHHLEVASRRKLEKSALERTPGDLKE